MFEHSMVFKRHPLELPALLFIYSIQNVHVATVDGISRQYCEKYLNLRKAEYNGTVMFLNLIVRHIISMFLCIFILDL